MAGYGAFPKDNHCPGQSGEYPGSSSPHDWPAQNYSPRRDDQSRAIRSNVGHQSSEDLLGIDLSYESLFPENSTGYPSFIVSGEGDRLEDGSNEGNQNCQPYIAFFNSGFVDDSTNSLGEQDERIAAWSLRPPAASGMQHSLPLHGIGQSRTMTLSSEGMELMTRSQAYTGDQSRPSFVNVIEPDIAARQFQLPWSSENTRDDLRETGAPETERSYYGRPNHLDDNASAWGVGSHDRSSVSTDRNGTTAITSVNPSSTDLSPSDATVRPEPRSGDSVSFEYIAGQNNFGTFSSRDGLLSVPQGPGSGYYALSPSPSNESSTPDVLECGASQCKTTFSGQYRKGNRARHRRDKHGDKVVIYLCEKEGCNKTYKRKDARLKHIRKKHRDLNPSAPIPRSAQ